MLEDVRKEYERKEEKFKIVIAELLDISPSLMRRNAELGEKWKNTLHDFYEMAAKLEDAQGLIVKFINICPLTRADIDRLY